ncbi:hypothetical protein K435DRAFT_522999 [Dendrothele bispora CBS 962.96]|uniref:Uncharacterized protein n=1 Tax=Dendrothele bispora (strain CBS 962.96) TaxID=1314807 RepID=A0A4V4HGG4_DENBC|nr:hypothetical protein K435DRAFT_522999 [Dendrothele bispora CBS 962.96]
MLQVPKARLTDLHPPAVQFHPRTVFVGHLISGVRYTVKIRQNTCVVIDECSETASVERKITMANMARSIKEHLEMRFENSRCNWDMTTTSKLVHGMTEKR